MICGTQPTETKMSIPAEASTPYELSVLMTRAQSGDRVSYAILLRECRDIAACIALAGGLAGAEREQMVEDTLVAVHLARHTYVRTTPFADWLRAIGNHHLALHLRQRAGGAPRPYGLYGQVRSRTS